MTVVSISNKAKNNWEPFYYFPLNLLLPSFPHKPRTHVCFGSKWQTLKGELKVSYQWSREKCKITSADKWLTDPRLENSEDIMAKLTSNIPFASMTGMRHQVILLDIPKQIHCLKLTQPPQVIFESQRTQMRPNLVTYNYGNSSYSHSM